MEVVAEEVVVEEKITIETETVEGTVVEKVVVEETILEEVIVEEHTKHGGHKPKARRYIVRINKQTYSVNHAIVTGRELLGLAGKTPETHKIYQHEPRHQAMLVEPDQQVDLPAPGIERFTTMPKDTTEGETALSLRRSSGCRPRRPLTWNPSGLIGRP